MQAGGEDLRLAVFRDAGVPPDRVFRMDQSDPDEEIGRLIAATQRVTDAMVASIGDQFCAIVKDSYDIPVSMETDHDNIPIQKLMLLINSLLENMCRIIASLSRLADDLKSQVRERITRLGLVVQGADDGVWIWDLVTGTAEFSPRWRQLLGLESSALSTIEAWLDRVHPDDIQRLRAALRAQPVEL